MIERPPVLNADLFRRAIDLQQRPDVAQLVKDAVQNYLYWSDLKYKKRPTDVTAEDVWACVKMNRTTVGTLQWEPFNIKMTVTIPMQKMCHDFDMNFGGSWGNSSIIPHAERERFLISSLIAEAISSSQMEGAATTRRVAKDMLRKGISPRNRSEQMIYNNYQAIRFITAHRDEDLSPELLLQLYRIMTQHTLSDERDVGRFRTADDDVVVENAITHEVVHTPPPAEMLPDFVERLCKMANSDDEEGFVHPILKAIYIHFVVAYVRPFVDGNGRTARALFYWNMLKNGYWLTEYLSISQIIYRSKASYETAFLQVEADNMDMGYFAMYHLHVLEMAFNELRNYIEKKILDKQRSMDFFVIGGINERQAAILSLVRDNPKVVLTVKEIENRFAVSHTTARNDIEGLVERGLLNRQAVNKVKSVYVKGHAFDEAVEKLLLRF